MVNFDLTSQDDEHDASSLGIDGYDSDEFYGLDVPLHPGEQADDDLIYLHEDDRRSIREAGLQQASSSNIDSSILNEDWTDNKISEDGEECIFEIDKATKTAWKNCTSEVTFIRNQLHSLLEIPETETISFDHLVDLAFGPQSDFASAFCNDLRLDRKTFLKFLGTQFLMMSYHETPSSMYDKYSELDEKVLIDEESNMGIWKDIALKKKVSIDNFCSFSRREKCTWQVCEEAVNRFLRRISISGRTDDVSIALDDDKIWVESSGNNAADDFGLRKVTHVKDNRKGIIAHTAVSATTNIPLAFMFERKGNSATDCFKLLFGKLFPPNNSGDLPNLNGVTNHSDRGYTIARTIFDFLLPAGADFNNTVKRIQPFPFIWGMKPSRNDQREVLDESGAPTLFIKEIMKSDRLVSISAFRTGTKNISAVLSTTIHGHRWEGIALNPNQTAAYDKDKQHGLDSLIFKLLASHHNPDLFLRHEEEIKVSLNELRNEKINVLTLAQGTADWHRARQFSLTSSQTDSAFRKALIIYQSDENWCNIAEYLYGLNYHQGKYYSFVISNFIYVNNQNSAACHFLFVRDLTSTTTTSLEC